MTVCVWGVPPVLGFLGLFCFVLLHSPVVSPFRAFSLVSALRALSGWLRLNKLILFVRPTHCAGVLPMVWASPFLPRLHSTAVAELMKIRAAVPPPKTMFRIQINVEITITCLSPEPWAKPYNNNNRRLVTLAEHTSDHGRQTNSSTEEKGEQV